VGVKREAMAQTVTNVRVAASEADLAKGKGALPEAGAGVRPRSGAYEGTASKSAGIYYWRCVLRTKPRAFGRVGVKQRTGRRLLGARDWEGEMDYAETEEDETKSNPGSDAAERVLG